MITALFFTLFQVSWQNYSLEQVKVKIAGPGNLHKTASTLKLRSLSVTVGLKYKNEFFRVSSWEQWLIVEKGSTTVGSAAFIRCVSPVIKAVEEAPSFFHSSCLFSFSPAGILCTVSEVTL